MSYRRPPAVVEKGGEVEGSGTRSLEWWAVGSEQRQAVDQFIGKQSAAQGAPCTLRNKLLKMYALHGTEVSDVFGVYLPVPILH